MKKKDYLNLPYHIVIQHITDEGDSYYFATVQEFDGCMSHGDTFFRRDIRRKRSGNG
ncbi:MAG: hypothetical protein LBJ86_02315 [Spirochaetaceae bacterium]|jgi:hypothetical protein|nr:hypothetical protein [Spirochaetaceae bacterium]